MTNPGSSQSSKTSPAFLPRQTHPHRIGFVSTRFKGIDGVSLETDKWTTVLNRMGHETFFLAGVCDQPEAITYPVPEAHFDHPDIKAIYEAAFTSRTRPSDLTRKIHRLAEFLEDHIYLFVKKFNLDLLIVENALTIPMNIPLGLALTEFIAETGMPTIAHHHDFFWERKRFLVNCVWDYLNMAFPPHLPSIHHVVINSSGQNQLSLRTGISSTLLPNVMDFDNPPSPANDFIKDLRQDLGIAPEEKFLLQPTRVVQRKGIENAIELVRRLDLKARLVISHASGDEGFEYERYVREFAELLKVPVNFISDIIKETRGMTSDGRKIYALSDAYQSADLITYPSTIEGFGNAFLEAIYYSKPVVVNNYSIFAIDIKPKGFNVVEFDGFITDHTVADTQRVLQDKDYREEMTAYNYQLAKRYYSYNMLQRHLETLISDCFGEEINNGD
jgi:glycosyltransferase involved in cell wall biosynthesis